MNFCLDGLVVGLHLFPIDKCCVTHLSPRPPSSLLCGLFSAAKPASGKRDYPQTIDTLAFIQDMHEKGFTA